MKRVRDGIPERVEMRWEKKNEKHTYNSIVKNYNSPFDYNTVYLNYCIMKQDRLTKAWKKKRIIYDHTKHEISFGKIFFSSSYLLSILASILS